MKKRVFKLGLFKRKDENRVDFSVLLNKSARIIDDYELEGIYGGCNLDYSPIASISENIIIDEQNICN